MGWILAACSLGQGVEPGGRPIAFRDVARESGIAFRFHTGSRGKRDLVEIMGGGVALIDADCDGLLDVYLCNGGPIGEESDKADPPCRFYLNEGAWRFRDATDAAGAPGPSYAMGAAVGDFDGDGRDDLFVTGWRDQRLYRNIGAGRFEDVTERAGLKSGAWSTSAAFADLDGDGDLDLYVCNYVDFDPKRAPFCAAPDGQRDYCGPEVFAAQADRLYRNDGDGTFTDVSDEAGIVDRGGRGLGLLIADFDDDRRLDIYVANDGSAAFLWRNKGGLSFEDIAARAGVAADANGEALAGMGTAWGDFDGDGRSDLFVTNYWKRGTVGFHNEGDGVYRALRVEIGLAPTRDVLGFGVALCDFDGDGNLDLLQTNGHVVDRTRLGDPFAMTPLLLENPNGKFVDASAGAGAWFRSAALGRGLAIGDLDNDGRPDVVATSLDSPVAVLRNVSAGPSMALELEARAPSHRSAIGASVRATIGGTMQTREVASGGSYLSAPARTVFLGMGEANKVDRMEVTWPSGRVEEWRDVAWSPALRLAEGSGTQAEECAFSDPEMRVEFEGHGGRL